MLIYIHIIAQMLQDQLPSFTPARRVQVCSLSPRVKRVSTPFPLPLVFLLLGALEERR
jgi:hypothetical protein